MKVRRQVGTPKGVAKEGRTLWRDSLSLSSTPSKRSTAYCGYRLSGRPLHHSRKGGNPTLSLEFRPPWHAYSFPWKRIQRASDFEGALTNPPVGYSSIVTCVGGSKCGIYAWVSRTTTGLTTCHGTRLPMRSTSRVPALFHKKALSPGSYGCTDFSATTVSRSLSGVDREMVGQWMGLLSRELRMGFRVGRSL